MSGLDLIITITDRSKCELFINWFRGRDIPLVLTALGQGTATTEILDCLGLEASEKSVLFCLAPVRSSAASDVYKRQGVWCAGRPGTCGWTCRATAY